MSMSVYNLVCLRFHGIFFTGVISQYHQQLVSKGILGLRIPIIGRVITIWGEVFFKIIVSLYKLVIRKKLFSDYSHCIEKYLDVVIEVLEVHSSVAFDFYLDEKFI